MTGDTPNLPESDRDYLEMLLYKLAEMYRHGSAYHARNMVADKKLFDQAKKDVNEFMTLLRKRGYSGERFNNIKPIQKSLF